MFPILRVKAMIPCILKSKKFLTSVVGVLIVVLSEIGLNLPEDCVNQIVAVIAAYVIGQGIADTGKEAKKLDVKRIPTEDSLNLSTKEH